MAEHSSNLRFPQLQPQYQAALMELNHGKLLGRVTEAEHAIFERLQSLEGTPGCQSRFAELLAIGRRIGTSANWLVEVNEISTSGLRLF